MSVSETANVQGTFINALRTLGLSIPSFSAVGTSSTALMRGGVPHPIDMMVVMDASGSMVSTMCGYAVGSGAGQSIAAGSTTDLDCAKEGVRSLLQTLYPCAPDQLDCTGQPSVDKVGLEIFPGLNDPNGVNHDSGFGLPEQHSRVRLPRRFDDVALLVHLERGADRHADGRDQRLVQADFQEQRRNVGANDRDCLQRVRGDRPAGPAKPRQHRWSERRGHRASRMAGRTRCSSTGRSAT